MSIVPQKPRIPKPENNNILVEQGAIRTYEKDMEQALRGEEGALVKETIERAREDQHARGSLARERSKNQVLVWLSILLICGSIFGLYYVWNVKQESAIPATPTVVPVIYFDTSTEKTTLPATADTVLETIIQAKVNSDTPGTLRRVLFTDNTNNPVESILLFQSLGWHIDEFLTHSLAGRSEVGIYTNNDGTKSPFILGTTDGSDAAYRGLATWEVKALEDTATMFDIETTTINDPIYQKGFSQITIKNKDGRALYNEQNKPLIIIEFLDNNHFIVTNSKDAVKEVLLRLAKEQSRNIVQ